MVLEYTLYEPKPEDDATPQLKNSRYTPALRLVVSVVTKFVGVPGAVIVRAVTLPYRSRTWRYIVSALGDPVGIHDTVVLARLPPSADHAQELPCVSVVGKALSLHRRYWRVLVSVAESVTVPTDAPPVDESRIAETTGARVSKVNTALVDDAVLFAASLSFVVTRTLAFATETPEAVEVAVQVAV